MSLGVNIVRRMQKEHDRVEKKKEIQSYEWYRGRKILSYCPWAIFLALLGGREAGKSYFVTNFFVDQFVNKNRPFYWLRLTEASQRKLLNNNAEKLIDPDLRRKYNLELITKGDTVFQVLKRGKSGKNGEKGTIIEKRMICRVLALSTFYNDKGSGLFDKDFLKDPNMYYNICLDEMNREKNEKKSFDIVYAFVNQLENLVRSTKKRIRVIMVGNTLEEASDILCSFNFIPEDFGTYKLKKKRAVIEYIEPSEAYKNRRKGTIADILLPDASTFTNKIETDKTLLYKGRLHNPSNVIKFTKERKDWFTVWDKSVIAKWHGEKKPVLAMRPYLDELFNADIQKNLITAFDSRSFYYKNLITFKEFQKNMELLKPRK